MNPVIGLHLVLLLVVLRFDGDGKTFDVGLAEPPVRGDLEELAVAFSKDGPIIRVRSGPDRKAGGGDGFLLGDGDRGGYVEVGHHGWSRWC